MESIVNLASVGNGAALELFDAEMKKVLINIADPNTGARKKRSITLKIVFTPDETRDQAQVTVSSAAVLAPIRQAESKAYFGRKDGALVAVENNPVQPSIFDEKGEGLKVVPLSKTGSEKGGSH